MNDQRQAYQRRGEVRVALRQTGREGDRADYELRVSDSGIGMS